jgi:hypothetical protein
MHTGVILFWTEISVYILLSQCIALSPVSIVIKHYTIKMYGEVEIWLPHILNFSIRWSASGHDCFIPRERTPGTHWIEGWVSPRAGRNAVTKIKIPVRFQAFTVVTIFCDVKQRGLVNIHQRFIRMNYTHLQNKRGSWTASSILCLLPAWLTLWLWYVWQPIILKVKPTVTV